MRKTLFIVLSIVWITLNFTAAAQKFEPNWQSLAENYKCPDWFRNAKFGIFMHWGIMSAIDENRDYGGSHYGRYMYGPGEFPPEHERSQWARDLNKWHTEHYGNPDEFGYKDFIPMFKAEKWNPDSLVAFYKEIGAKYIVPVAVHHDNFDMYKSIHRWNAYEMGPKKDIIQGWKEAAEKHGIRFGVSSHLDRVSSFFQVSRKFDGGKPEYADFYGSNYNIEHQKDENWQKVWYDRTMQLIDRYKPDLLYFDGSLPGIYDDMKYGFEVASHFYNSNIEKHGGKLEAVMNLKHGPDKRAFIWDIEKGQADALQHFPWQTDTDLSGGWYYRKTEPQFTPAVLVGNLIDIVSKNGNLLLNVGLRGNGTLPENQASVLRELGKWLKVNGEGIYGSRPWLVYGEGPTKITSGAFQEQKKPYTEEDIRFTTKDGYLYAFVLKIPEKQVKIRSLSNLLTLASKVENVELLGSTEKLKWERTNESLDIQLPSSIPCKYALTFKIKLDVKSRQMWKLIIE
jgi:alpha-L-fucosidase